MSKSISSLLVFFIIILNLVLVKVQYAQAPDTLWTKTFGESDFEIGNSVEQTTDGGYIIVGCIDSGGTDGSDIWLIKTDQSGDTLWTRAFGDIYGDGGNSVQQTTDGGYIITGWMSSVPGASDVSLIKTDQSGDTLWTRTFGGSHWDGGNTVRQTTDGGYIITGWTESFGAGHLDVWLIKTNELGNIVWTKTFGGIHQDMGYSVQQTTDGGYIIIGKTCSFGAGHPSTWLIKTNQLGDTLWTKVFDSREGQSVQQTNDGGYIVTGASTSRYSGDSDIWLIKTNDLGDTLWSKTIGGKYGAFYSDWGQCVQQTTDSGFIIIGNTQISVGGEMNVWLIKTNALGDTLWTKMLGGNDYDQGCSVKQTADGGYIIVGGTDSFSSGDSDIWLIKTAPDLTNVDENNKANVLRKYILNQNFPNPFNPTTTIEFSIPRTEFVTLKIFNILGQEVANLVSDRLTAGNYKYTWDARHLASGVYYYQLKTENDHIQSKKLVLLK